MIERFNFYDVYGYFLPGVALLALVWLPFGLVQGVWPANAFSSAIAALAFAYILGNVLQTVAAGAFPSQRRDHKGIRRHPSDLFLDSDDPTFPRGFKEQLQRQVTSAFALDLSLDQYGGGNSEITGRRKEAFFLCRGVLIRANIASYSEQFEGMYALMRGLAASFWLGSMFLFGWVVSLLQPGCFLSIAGTAAVASLGGAAATSLVLMVLGPRYRARHSVDKLTALMLHIALFCLGARLGADHCISHSTGVLFLVVALAAFFAGIRCYGAYTYFAEEFAKAVWRDFLGLRTSSLT